MILNSLKRAGKPKTSVLEVGTVVRVEAHAIAETRALGPITARAQRHRGALSRYLPKLHKVVGRKEPSNSTPERRTYLYMVDGRASWFHRNELQVVENPEELIGPKRREDISFGQTHMKDAFLRGLHEDGVQRELDRPQSEVENDEAPPVTRAMAEKVDEVLPDDETPRPATARQQAVAKKKKKTPGILGTVIRNMPGSMVRDPGSKGLTLDGIVLRATVTSRTKKGRYLLDIEGSVPSKGGYVERDDLALVERRGLSAAVVKRLQRLTLNQASEFTA
jgi:hypothetical protein